MRTPTGTLGQPERLVEGLIWPSPWHLDALLPSATLECMTSNVSRWRWWWLRPQFRDLAAESPGTFAVGWPPKWIMLSKQHWCWVASWVMATMPYMSRSLFLSNQMLHRADEDHPPAP